MKKLKKSIVALLLLVTIIGIHVLTYATNADTNDDLNKEDEINKEENEIVEENYEFSNMKTKIFLSDAVPQGSNNFNYYKDLDSNNNKFSLLEDGKEKEYDKGILTIPSSQIYLIYTDIQEQGYRFFSADIGINKTSRDKESSVKFAVYADDKEVYSKVVSSQDELTNIVIPLKDVKVLKIAVDTVSGSQPHAVWGNAAFYKEAETPYLAVDDLEFNLAEQVTASNILEYAIATDKDGNDITKSITYETNYNGEESGQFKVLYSVTDESGNTHKRIVNMTITGEDYSKRLSLERLKEPWAAYLYHGRGILSTQGKKAWDILLKEVLNFDKNKWQETTRYNEAVYVIDVDLQANGIYAKKAELTTLGSMFMDDEPRTFVMKDWGCEISEKDGLASHVKVWLLKELADEQDSWLEKIENNTVEMLSVKEDDMSEVQRLYVVKNKYKDWVQYGDGGQLLHNSLGNQRAVCGGNARGYIYLSQRLGTKSVWGRSDNHAWSFTKTYEYDYWFTTDLLGAQFLVEGVKGEAGLAVGRDWKTRHYKWFTFGTEPYPTELFKYPSVWVTVNTQETFITKNKSYNLLDYITDYGSIFNAEFPKENITVKVDRITKDEETIKSDIKDFPVSGDGTDLKAGLYRVTYLIEDKGKTNSTTLNLRVTNGSDTEIPLEEGVTTGNVNKVDSLGLWTGTEEKYYTNAIEAKENASITFNIADKGYKYLMFDYGIKDSVRANTSYGQNGKVQVIVYADDNVIYQGSVLGWKTKYETVALKIPEGTTTVKIESKAVGAGNNHAGICDLRFITDDGSNDFEEAKIVSMPQKIIADIGERVTITPIIEESDGKDEYQWYKDGEKLEGQTNLELILDSMKIEDEGNYTLKITSTLEDEQKETTSSECQLFTSEFRIPSGKYIIEETIISKIPQQTTVAEFKENVRSGYDLVFKNANGEVLNDADILTTDTIIKVGEDKEYVLCVTGDLDKDGQITINDLSIIKMYFIGQENLESTVLKAANMDEDNQITVNDIASMKLMIINN